MAVSEPAAKGFQFPYAIRMERRLTTPKWLPVATSIGALVVAFFIGGIVIRAAGGQPVSAYGHIVEAAFGSLGVFNDTMVKATPLILVGLACALAFRMKLWNIGAEGQFFLGAWGASAVVLLPILPADTPRGIMLAVMAVAGFICGALWGFIPGYLKAKLNVSEIITTLMLNYIAVSWVLFWVFGCVERGRFPDVAAVPEERLDAAPVGVRRHVQGLPGLDAAWGHPLRHRGRLRGVVYHFTQPLGLRDPADRR